MIEPMLTQSRVATWRQQATVTWVNGSSIVSSCSCMQCYSTVAVTWINGSSIVSSCSCMQCYSTVAMYLYCAVLFVLVLNYLLGKLKHRNYINNCTLPSRSPWCLSLRGINVGILTKGSREHRRTIAILTEPPLSFGQNRAPNDTVEWRQFQH